jgi:hypothetical protein
LQTQREITDPQIFPVPERHVTKARVIPSNERIVEALIQLTFATKLHRIIVTGPQSPKTLLELHRRGYLRVTTAALCDIPCGQFDVALVAWREHSIKALETALEGLVHFLSSVGVLVVWVAARDRISIQLLRLALDRLGFRIEAGTACETGVAISARRPESNSIARFREVIAPGGPNAANCHKRTNVIMHKDLLEYLERAAECVRLAEGVEHPELKLYLTKLAASWTKMAAEAVEDQFPNA